MACVSILTRMCLEVAELAFKCRSPSTMAKSLAEAHADALQAKFGDDATPLEALWTSANMFLLVFAQVKVVQYWRDMLLRAALNGSMKPFDPTVLDKLVGAHPVVQEAVVCHSSQAGLADIVYPDSLGGGLAVRV